MKVIVFDLGGTLMEFQGMPPCWADYYEQGLRYANAQLGIYVSEAQLQQGIEILKQMNPRINYREEEYTAEFVFNQVLTAWRIKADAGVYANIFFEGLPLTVKIYKDIVSNLVRLKEEGYFIAAFTDVPTGMPEAFYQRQLKNLLPYFDFYVSSQTCGWRKPNPKGLFDIAAHFQVPVKELLFIGDEAKDEQAAQNAGCRFLNAGREKERVKTPYMYPLDICIE